MKNILNNKIFLNKEFLHMKIKILIALLLVILTIGAANAADNITSDNPVASENLDIQSSNVTESSNGDFSDLFNLINCSSETLELFPLKL